MKKYLFIVAIVALVIIASGCTSLPGNNNASNTTTKTYSSNEINFDYPDSWNVNNASKYNVEGIILTDKDFNETNGTKGTVVIITKIPKTINSSTEMAQILNNVSGLNETIGTISIGSIISNSSSGIDQIKSKIPGSNSTNGTISIAGTTANETTFSFKVASQTLMLQNLEFEKNNFKYMIQFITINTDLKTQQQYFDIITKSFQVQ